jgi:hypothetical protein
MPAPLDSPGGFEKVAARSQLAEGQIKRAERSLWLACIGGSITLGLLAGTFAVFLP